VVTCVPRRVDGNQFDVVDAHHVAVGHRMRMLVAGGGVEAVHGCARLFGQATGERTVIWM